MTATTPVRDRAFQLQSEIRRLEAGKQGQGQAERIANRVAEARVALSALAERARAARALAHHAGVTVAGLAHLTDGLDSLERRAAGSVPSDQAFVSAKTRIDQTAKQLSAEVQAAWKAWADERLGPLPVRRIAMLDPVRQGPAQAAVKSLRNLAADRSVSAADIASFASEHQSLTEELSEAADVPEELLAVLDRVSAPDQSLTLRDLSDEEIALLRLYRMDDEIEVRRKSG